MSHKWKRFYRDEITGELPHWLCEKCGGKRYLSLGCYNVDPDYKCTDNPWEEGRILKRTCEQHIQYENIYKNMGHIWKKTIVKNTWPTQTLLTCKNCRYGFQHLKDINDLCINVIASRVMES